MNPRELTTVHHQAAPPLAAWLDVLRAILPPHGTLVVGAGNGTGSWVQWLARQPTGLVWLVEGDETQYQHLRRHVPANCDWVLRRDVVAATADVTTFYRVSNPAESGLIAPDRLRGLWPHVELVHTELEVTAVTLDDLWDNASESFNWLVLDCLPAAALLRGGTKLLAQADVVVVRVATDEQLGIEPPALQSAANDVLTAAGLRCSQLWRERHPGLLNALYVRDVARLSQALAAVSGEAAQTRHELQQALATIGQLRAAHQVLQESVARADAELNLMRGKLEEAQRARKTGEADLGDTNAQLRRLEDRANDVRHLLKQLLNGQEVQLVNLKQHQESKTLETLDLQRSILGALDQIQDKQAKTTEVLQSAERQLLQVLKDNIQQVENYIGIVEYLRNQNIPLHMHGWPISPDLGVFIIELLESGRFNAVLEFGSGTSTVLLAKGVSRHRTHGSSEANRIEFYAFEHLPHYLSDTAKRLESWGLQDWVQLIFAPLKSIELPSRGSFDYYDVIAQLAHLQVSLNYPGARILVFADGPPAVTGKHARYPVMPLLFKYFPSAAIEIVLDDFGRADEQEIVEMWIADAKAANRSISKRIKNFEKGAVHLIFE